MTIKIQNLELMTTAEAAEYAHISQRRIQQLCQFGVIGLKVGRNYMVAKPELDKKMAEVVKFKK